ncbi:MAG: HAMP domain-containing sensor histidine kinase [Eubacteriales bacterium]|nr:HAMP domain-containing sensor histidine kinase [Eubacteriales bacterium]
MRSSKIISRLDNMLTEAMNGSFVEASYDETELSRLESKFRRYIMMKETASEKVEAERSAIKELVTDISHQTKTPLSNVLLYTQLLKEQCTDENVALYIDQISMQTAKLEFLIQSLVKISRLESGMVVLSPSQQPVEPLLTQAIEIAGGRAKAKGITVKFLKNKDSEDSFGEKDICALYDFRWTLEALGNLLDNAVKYSPAGSTVTVRVKPFEMFVCISVEDTGIGIPEAEQAQIFERFYRGKNAGKEEGSGVGLYLTRMILSKERGYIKVTSKENQGSTFLMYLLRE